jgi:hypothetical protein
MVEMVMVVVALAIAADGDQPADTLQKRLLEIN